MGFDLGGGGVARYHYDIDKQRTRKHITRKTTAGATGMVEDRIYLGGYELYRRRNPGGTWSRRSSRCTCSKASSGCCWWMM